MKVLILLPSLLLLLLWMPTARTEDTEVIVIPVDGGFNISCVERATTRELSLSYIDENSGTYPCEDSKNTLIHVKFRTCENCVDLDEIWVTGLALGDVVATVAIGVAVYLIASHGPIGPVAPQRKSSSAPHNAPRVKARDTDGGYQELMKNNRNKEYDELS